MLKYIIPSRYLDELITELLAEPDPAGLAGLHFLDTEAFFEYICRLQMKNVIYTQTGSK